MSKIGGKRFFIIGIVVALIVVYAVFDPSGSVLFPKCLFYQITGWQCPGCGSQRMIHALLQCDFASAWRYNAYLFFLLPVILFLLWLELTRKKHPQLYRKVYSMPVIWTFIVLTLTWFVVRNLLEI